ncbi:hypothetical protein E8E14_007047 [Neopestalotiopsis sp. 37M]|nr:hypothetical protein E8E14_007047 [Neopestalotiopsis sp. 37M]
MSPRYADIHKNPGGPGDRRPTAAQIIQDEGLENKLAGKVILITGCSSGIGIETARALALTRATLYLTARDLEKAKGALGDLIGNGNVHLLQLDLSSFESVRECAAEFLARSETLNILIANAGIMIPPAGRTADGFKLQFGTNHLAHFLLFQLLQDTLLRSATSDMPSRVIMVSSSGHRASEVRFDDYNFDNGYDAWEGYGQSKTAMIWTSNEVERRFGARGLHSYSLHPGGIATGLQQHVGEDLMKQWATIPNMMASMKSIEQGAATTVWAAVARDLAHTGGKYLEDCQIIGPLPVDATPLDPGYAPWVYDEDKASRLYDLSLKLTSVPTSRF